MKSLFSTSLLTDISKNYILNSPILRGGGGVFKSFVVFRNVFIMLCCSVTFAFSQSLQDGIKAMDNENYRSAKKIFITLTNKNAMDAEAYYYAGRAYYALEQKDSAKLFFDKGVAANPKLAFNYIGLGRLSLDINNTTDAKNNFDKAVSLAPKDIKTLQLIGEAYANCSVNTALNAPDAITVLNKALALDKKNPTTFLFLGDAYLNQLNGGGQALTNYEYAAQYAQNAAMAQCRIGILYGKAKNYNEALTAFQKSIAADSTYAPAHRELGELYYRSNQYPKAKETYAKYMALADKTIENQSRYGSFLFLAKDYENTISIISQVIEKDPENFILSRLIAYSYYEKGKYTEGLDAMNKFFKAIESKKILASDYEYYGKLLAKTGSDSLAIINLNKCMSMDSSRGELHGEIAQIYYKKKRYLEAAQELELKIAHTKPNIQDFNQLGLCYYKSESFVKADSAFAKVIQLNPNAYQGYLWRGKCNWQIDSTMTLGSAKPFYEKAIELAISDTANANNRKALVDSYTYLGTLLIKNDKETEGVQYFQKILALDPNNEQAKEIVNNAKKAGSTKSKS